MKYLGSAYRDKREREALGKSEQRALPAQVEAIRDALETKIPIGRAWDGRPTIAGDPFIKPKTPQAGFSIVEAADLNELIQLVESDAVRPRERNQTILPVLPATTV